jgi:RNA polymerase sigma-70 factor (ECF subfamily)
MLSAQTIELMTYRSSPAVATRADSVVQLGTDDALAAAARAGDETAFAELFTRYKKMVAAIGGRFFARREQIEEIIQTTFYQAYLALGQYQGGQEHSFAAWLKRIAVNSCLDELRRVQRRQENLVSELNDQEAEYLLERVQTEWETPGIERRTIARDLAEKLLARLEPEDRLALLLLYEDEWSVAEIGELLGWSISKVKGRAHRARQTLQRVMKRLR